MPNDTKDRYGPLIGAIDEGTSSTRFLVFASKTAEILTYHQLDIPHITLKEGWVEQDPIVILNSVIETINVTCENLKKLRISYEDIITVGIANQRETTILWDPTTGKPLYNALVWLDMRTASTVDEILNHGKRETNFLQSKCGLPVSTYFSAIKIKWIMDNVEGVRETMMKGKCMFGTIDTWIIWNLTGGVNGGLHITDVTNASRTMLMNIETLQWDSSLCEEFDIPMTILPEIRSCSEIYGYIKDVTTLTGIPISGIVGDQQAALLGQMCFNQGQAKCTYGTGCFLLYNTGTNRIMSEHGLLTTVAYKFGSDVPVYALEGSIAVAGVALRWLRDNLQLFESFGDVDTLAKSVGRRGSVYFVPAFSGLYAPYWRKDARGVICGITDETEPGHFAKAALEAVGFQVRDVLQAMTKDCGIPINQLLVDGGMTKSEYFMQMQSDYSGIPVVRPTMAESTALGAAFAAGNARGIEVWNIHNIPKAPVDTFYPSLPENERDVKYAKWLKAIQRSLNWAVDPIPESRTVDERDKSVAIPGGLFVFISMGMLLVSAVILSRR